MIIVITVNIIITLKKDTNKKKILSFFPSPLFFNVYICTYIYIGRERERERDQYQNSSAYIYRKIYQHQDSEI